MSRALQRDPIKYIRDFAKSAYVKDSKCKICGKNSNLDFHHYYSLTPLFNKWCKSNKIKIENEADILAIRERFINEHHAELYEHAVTLCHDHHLKLHSIYGKDPSLATASKQERWVELQRAKHYGITPVDIRKT